MFQVAAGSERGAAASVPEMGVSEAILSGRVPFGAALTFGSLCFPVAATPNSPDVRVRFSGANPAKPPLSSSNQAVSAPAPQACLLERFRPEGSHEINAEPPGTEDEKEVNRWRWPASFCTGTKDCSPAGQPRLAKGAARAEAAAVGDFCGSANAAKRFRLRPERPCSWSVCGLQTPGDAIDGWRKWGRGASGCQTTPPITFLL